MVLTCDPTGITARIILWRNAQKDGIWQLDTGENNLWPVRRKTNFFVGTVSQICENIFLTEIGIWKYLEYRDSR